MCPITFPLLRTERKGQSVRAFESHNWRNLASLSSRNLPTKNYADGEWKRQK